MRYTLLASSGLLAVASAAAVESSQRKSYDGYKVFRLKVGEDVAKVNNIIDTLGLTTWKGKPRVGVPADIVVPPSQVDAFEAQIAGMEAVTMHEDLGASIADESNFSVYAGMAIIIHCTSLDLGLTSLLSWVSQYYVVQLVPQLP
jgi:hypothetical protein